MLKRALVAMFLLPTATEAVAADPALPYAPVKTQVVHYDAATDRLSLDVHELPLTQVLGRISRQSGVEILAGQGIDHPVTASVQNQPLEQALGALTRDMNAVMIHDQREVPGHGMQPVLVRMELLPAGQNNKALLRPVRGPRDAAMPYTVEGDPTGSHTGRFLGARRQARLQQMGPARRQRLQEQAAAKAEAQAAESGREARNRQRRLERLNRQLAQAQALAATDPEASQQSIQRINQKIARIQHRQEKTTGASSP